MTDVKLRPISGFEFEIPTGWFSFPVRELHAGVRVRRLCRIDGDGPQFTLMPVLELPTDGTQGLPVMYAVEEGRLSVWPTAGHPTRFFIELVALDERSEQTQT